MAASCRFGATKNPTPQTNVDNGERLANKREIIAKKHDRIAIVAYRLLAANR
jgi:hypothetical protein